MKNRYVVIFQNKIVELLNCSYKYHCHSTLLFAQWCDFQRSHMLKYNKNSTIFHVKKRPADLSFYTQTVLIQDVYFLHL